MQIPRLTRCSVPFMAVWAVVLGAGGALPAATARGEEAQWTEDAAAAFKAAQAGGQDVLMDFTGSDWCHWCQQLDKEVFEEAEFKEGAAKGWRLLKLDFPNGRQLPEAIKAQNAQWQKKFSIQGYPTVMLVDAKGRPFGRMGYQEGGPGPFLKAMAEARARRVARDAKWAEAAKAQGGAKAKLLDEGLQAIGDDKLVFAHYKAELVEAMKLDADGSAGVKARYEAKLKAAQAQKKFEEAVPAILESAEQDPEAAIRKLTELAGDKDMSADFRQKALFLASQVCRAEVKDMARAEKIFDAAVAVAPDSQFGLQLQMHKAKVYPAK